MGSNNFTAEWLKYAIPYKDDRPDACLRYEYIAPVDITSGTCSTSNFNQSNVIRCDSFIIKNNEERLVSRVRHPTIAAAIISTNLFSKYFYIQIY